MQSAIHKEKKKLDIESIAEIVLEVLLYVSCLFPFTMWIPAWYTGTDSQPYAFAISILVILYYGIVKKEKSMPKPLFQIGLCILFLSAYAITDAFGLGFFFIAKRYVTFASVFSITLAFYYTCKNRGRINEVWIKAAIWIWLFVGAIQMWIKPDFAARFVMRQTTDMTRGVVSLATEPSAYGYYCLFLLLLIWGFQKNRLLYTGLVILQILGLAQSSVTLMYIAIYLVGYAVNDIWVQKKKAIVKYISIIFTGGVLACIAYVKHLLPYRMHQIIDMVLRRDWNGILKDGSITKRLEGIIQSTVRFINNLGLPQGFGGERYFSGNGILLVEGGFVSVLLLGLFAMIIWKAYPKKYRLMFAFGFLIVMFSAIPYSCPVVGMYLGLCVYLGPHTSITIREIGIKICKKWKSAVLVALVVVLLAGGVRYIKAVQIQNGTYHTLLIENKYSSKEELQKLLTEEEYKEVEEVFACWKIQNGYEDTEGKMSKEEAGAFIQSYEVSFSYPQQRLCTLLIYEYMGKDLSEYLGGAQNSVIVRTGENSYRGLFLLLVGIFGAIFVLGMYEGKVWNWD